MATLDEFIQANCVVGTISDGHHHAQVLACGVCGSFLWDVEKHFAVLHGEAVEAKHSGRETKD